MEAIVIIITQNIILITLDNHTRVNNECMSLQGMNQLFRIFEPEHLIIINLLSLIKFVMKEIKSVANL